MDIKMLDLSYHGDERGGLVSLESCKNIPFEIRRVYYLFETKKNISRGYHAHKDLKQIAVALKGSCRFILDDGKERKEVILNSPQKGLYIDSFIWREMHDFSEDCVLLVLASNYFDESDYVREYSKFLEGCQNE
ncbi:FdtA/QdtA family cupin domain-containing protein [Buttiauxella sp. A2-C1_F]|uniref:sugar 3,4-ketoisomerase n=1 Tax=Buttiauxella sp. A2-C1_F TaxID=2904526 RepID=UPI001E501A94|nr:FdtA/QdtA family cupin domain-containing protein [Buttiauxella sp. A2-C1_F]MCE0846435.1 FdtA/QdtA family cupin domain-containing protein [Buttiauxella sp. A2-C1_F]